LQKKFWGRGAGAHHSLRRLRPRARPTSPPVADPGFGFGGRKLSAEGAYTGTAGADTIGVRYGEGYPPVRLRERSGEIFF